MVTLRPDIQIDGYRMIRPIGSGGFGDVWLCCADAIDRLCAMKVVRVTSPEHARRELEAIKLFKNLNRTGESVGVVPIEHVGVFESSLYYTMPLADGVGAESPKNTDWQPLTLARLIEQWRVEQKWPSSRKIKDLMLPVARATGALVDAKLVHGDIKPENILIMDGKVVLSDISLLDRDHEDWGGAGTVGFGAPHWYLESGGHPDMFGLAATLFTVLSGNSPDKLGRAAFMWPPQGKESLCAGEQKEWKRLHRVIFRAMEDQAAERFISFGKLADAIGGGTSTGKPQTKPGWTLKRAVTAAILILTVGVGGFWTHQSLSKADRIGTTEPQMFDPEALSRSTRSFYADRRKNSAIPRRPIPSQRPGVSRSPIRAVPENANSSRIRYLPRHQPRANGQPESADPSVEEKSWLQKDSAPKRFVTCLAQSFVLSV